MFVKPLHVFLSLKQAPNNTVVWRSLCIAPLNLWTARGWSGGMNETVIRADHDSRGGPIMFSGTGF